MEKRFVKYARIFFISLLGVLLLVIGVIEAWVFTDGFKEKVEVGGKFGNLKTVVIGVEETLEDKQEVKMKGEIVAEADARPIIVERYLKRYRSPLAPYAKKIVELSDRYGFDYYWMVAIAQQESNLCKKAPEDSHNCWGYGIHSQGTLKFENYDLALESYAQYLKSQYFDKGLNTAELMMQKYCPHSNGSWARGVNQFIGDMESGKRIN